MIKNRVKQRLHALTLISLFCFGTAVAAPPRQEPTIVLDIAAPVLEELLPGRAAAKVWQGTAATTYTLQLTPGSEQEALAKLPKIDGQTALYLVKGALEVEFETTRLNMKQGDVAMWGPLQHDLHCLSNECLVFIMAVLDNSTVPKQDNASP